MYELGNVIPRITWTLATAPDKDIPFLMSKVDLKDGFWQMIVLKEDSYNFAYVLPKTNESDPTQIVIPNSLQMGWVNSPGFFCAATETARDVADTNITNNVKTEKQKFEKVIMNFPLSEFQWLDNTNEKFRHLVEVYVDNFILLLQTTS